MPRINRSGEKRSSERFCVDAAFPRQRWRLGPQKSQNRDFLDRIFPVIEKHAHGSAVLTKMARSLAEQTSFPDLEGWEDADLKKSQARDATTALKSFLSEREKEAACTKEREETRRRVGELQQRSAERRQTLEKLAARLDQLAAEIGSQEAGYQPSTTLRIR